MTTYNKRLILILASLILSFSDNGFFAVDVDSVTLYTPYTKISVPPGESIDYTIDVINKGNRLQNLDISMAGMPRGWDYDLKSGGWNVRQISVLPDEKKSLNLRVEVPLKVNKGSYQFRLLAGSYSLPLVVIVSEQGTFKTEFTTNQPNMEGPAKSNFTFNTVLKNRTADEQLYALRASAPIGWSLNFKANYKQATSVTVPPNSDMDITIDITAPDQIEAGTYKIPVSASTNLTSASLELEVVITGSYNMELTTPRGLLSAVIIAGDEKRIELLIRNTGSSELKNINMDFSAPVNWDVEFDPKNIFQIPPGGSAKAFAVIKADKKAITGDYITNIEAKTPEVSSKAAFRITVKTSLGWGWIGVMIIVAALGSVYYLFRKYGRR